MNVSTLGKISTDRHFWNTTYVGIIAFIERQRESKNLPICVTSFNNALLSVTCVDITVFPMAKAWSFPSAMMATTVFSPTAVILAFGWVKPGHMMLAPDRTNLMAPLSTRSWGRMNGYWCNNLRVGHQAPSLCRKKRSWPAELTYSVTWLNNSKFCFQMVGTVWIADTTCPLLGSPLYIFRYLPPSGAGIKWKIFTNALGK